MNSGDYGEFEKLGDIGVLRVIRTSSMNSGEYGQTGKILGYQGNKGYFGN